MRSLHYAVSIVLATVQVGRVYLNSHWLHSLNCITCNLRSCKWASINALPLTCVSKYDYVNSANSQIVFSAPSQCLWRFASLCTIYQQNCLLFIGISCKVPYLEYIISAFFKVVNKKIDEFSLFLQLVLPFFVFIFVYFAYMYSILKSCALFLLLFFAPAFPQSILMNACYHIPLLAF